MGELSALGSALLWAASSIVYRDQSERIGATALNALRCAFAAVFFALVVLATGRLTQFASVPPRSYAVLVGSVFIGIAVGDTAYLRSMALVGVSRALPISGSYPLFTMVISLFFLREPLTLPAIAGAILVVGGVYLVALPREDGFAVQTRPAAASHWGIVLALFASVCWAVSSSALGWGMGSVDVALANTVRLPVAALVLGLFALRQTPRLGAKGLEGKSLGLVAVAGVVGTGFGGLLFLAAIQQTGAAIATTLTSTAPLFAVPLSRLILRERVTRLVAAGTVLSFAGIALIVLRTA